MKKLQHHLKSVFERKDISGLSVFGFGHHFDWKFLLSSFFLLVLGVLLFSIYVFLGVREGGIFQDKNTSVVKTVLINKNGLEMAIQDFSSRAEHLKALQAQKPVLVDPSQ